MLMKAYKIREAGNVFSVHSIVIMDKYSPLYI